MNEFDPYTCTICFQTFSSKLSLPTFQMYLKYWLNLAQNDNHKSYVLYLANKYFPEYKERAMKLLSLM